MKTIPAESLFKKIHKDKEYRKIYEKVAPLMDLAMKIACAREDAGLTQSQLASKLETTQSVISRIEQGNQNLSFQMLSRIASVLNCHLEVGLKPIHRKAA